MKKNRLWEDRWDAGRRNLVDRRQAKKSGTTLVELMVSLLLVSILMVMVAGIVSPAFKTFIRLQKTQFAQMILDNTAQELKNQTREATEYVKIYGNTDASGAGVLASDGTGEMGVGTGNTIEFKTTDGYVVLLSASGSPETEIYRGSVLTETEAAIAGGQLMKRYYVADENDTYRYQTAEGAYSARAVTTAFASGYYMGNYLTVEFSYPDGVTDGAEVTYLKAKLSLYSDETCTNLVAEDTAILDFRYRVIRKDAATAKKEGM